MSAWQELSVQMDMQSVGFRLWTVLLALLLSGGASFWLINSMSEEYRQQLERLHALPGQASQQQQALSVQLSQAGNSQVKALKQQVEAAAGKLDALIYERLSVVRDSEAGAEILQRAVEQLMRHPGKLASVDVKRMQPVPLSSNTPETKSGDTDTQSDTANAGNQTVDSAATLYKNGVQLTLRGAWFDLLEHLEILEEVSPQLFWHSFELQSDAYPYSTLKLTLFTVSGEAP